MSGKTKEELKAELDQARQDALDTERRLLEEREAMLDEMYAAGLRKRPTMLGEIEKVEAEYRARIYDLVEKCEQKTGRALSLNGILYSSEEEDLA